jgi:hypothetical protein
MIGPYHMDIFGKTASGGIRGPFELVLAKPKSASTYPSLWAQTLHESAPWRVTPTVKLIPSRDRHVKKRRSIVRHVAVSR